MEMNERQRFYFRRLRLLRSSYEHHRKAAHSHKKWAEQALEDMLELTKKLEDYFPPDGSWEFGLPTTSEDTP